VNIKSRIWSGYSRITDVDDGRLLKIVSTSDACRMFKLIFQPTESLMADEWYMTMTYLNH
jgi:hypothetical protein